MSLPDVGGVLAALVPWPEDGTRPEGPVAVDATDRLLLDEAGDLVSRSAPGDVVVIGDRFGALTLGALALGARGVRTHTDAVTAEQALVRNAEACSALLAEVEKPHAEVESDLTTSAAGAGSDEFTVVPALGRELLAGARVVLLQLPKSLAELTEVAEHVAREAADDVVLLAGGRIKHMTPRMNAVLAASFADVRATLARQKSRLLIASKPRIEHRGTPLTYPVTARLDEPEVRAALQGGGLTVVAHGAAFAGAALDLGTRFLLSFADRWPDVGRDGRLHAVDLGCGTGILAMVLARRGADVVAVDASAAAVASTAATATANGVADRVRVVRDDAGASLPADSADLVLCNPPFHDRAALSVDAAHRMFATAGRVLRPGGELWTVFNTQQRYRPALARAVGPTELMGQDPRFTVTRSRRP